MDRKEFEKLSSEGNRGFMDLCRLARGLGYKDELRQMINSDGSCCGDLHCFLQDNPGAIQAIYNWIDENYEDDIEDEPDICNICGAEIDFDGCCECDDEDNDELDNEDDE